MMIDEALRGLQCSISSWMINSRCRRMRPSADEERWGMSRAELEKRILRLYKGGTGILKIGKALGIGHWHGAARADGAAAPFPRRRR